MEIRAYTDRVPMPVRATDGAAGLDLYASESLGIPPGGRRLVSTGLRIEIPAGYVGLICPRSGLALRQGMTVLNAPGVVDSDYRGEVGVILVNLSEDMRYVHHGDRIAQLVILPCVGARLTHAEHLSETARGGDGFGSTGC